MRLIDCTTLHLEEFLGSDIPQYAILSHTWGKEELSFAEFNSGQTASISKEGYTKISLACRQALRHGLQYAWVDTCCIDKTSSAELSEAINSMFQWYKKSSVCYAYLSDVKSETFDMTFPQSRWFRRGWTLQELIAPPGVIFFDQDWHELGTKDEHATLLSEITGIDMNALCGVHYYQDGSEAGLEAFPVARRMSWASNRETTRVEDTAYALLGIFNVNMPLLYGEGEKAFIRLQEEIIKHSNDESILAWGLDTEVEQFLEAPLRAAESISGAATFSPPLASSPKDFRDCHGLEYGTESNSPFMMTNLGLQIELPLVPVCYKYDPEEIEGWVGLLNCGTGTDSELPGILLYPAGKDDTTRRFERIQFGRPLKQTGLVGARVAAQAVPTKVTIIQYNESRSARDYIFGYCQVIINESPTIRNIGYYISNAFASDVERISWASPYHLKWDPGTKILTVPGSHITNDLITLNFKSKKICLDPEFSILICGGNAIVRKGLSFTWTENYRFRDILKIQSPQEEEDMFLTCSDGIEFKIVVVMRMKMVCHWQIIQVDVDANIRDLEIMDNS
ncbi:MAG: hypothetical protein M1813_003622 [Trichoglossum hirsutum]|nr:MAG: hypothetical protein M1813_003622 [Trichoglossum hirsutum]